MDKMVKEIVLISAGILLIILFLGIMLKRKEMYLGFYLGGFIALLNFYMISKDAEIIVKSGGKAKKAAVFKFLKRYFWVFIIITVAVKVFRFNNFIGLIVGLFVVQAAIIIQKIILRK